jgi:hypothetical protein
MRPRSCANCKAEAMLGTGTEGAAEQQEPQLGATAVQEFEPA